MIDSKIICLENNRNDFAQNYFAYGSSCELETKLLRLTP